MKLFWPVIQWAGTIFLYGFIILILSLSLSPGLGLIYYFFKLTEPELSPLWILGFSLSIIIALFIFGFTVMAIVIILRTIFRYNYKEGPFPFHSYNVFMWGSYNALILTVRFTIMDFLRATPLLPLFHRLMGAKIGKNVQINTKVIADSRLLEIGDNTVIGGDAQIICHSAEGGQLKIARTKIGKNVTIGILAVILPGCEIGDGATIAACTLVPKNSRIPPNTVWGGVPAKQLRSRDP